MSTNPEMGENTPPITNSVADESSWSVYRFLLQWTFILINVVVLIGVYHFLIKKDDGNKIAIVDINKVVELQQKQFSKIISESDRLSEKDRRQVIEEIQDAGKNLSESLNKVKEHCNCTLLVKNAVVANNLPDLTQQLLIEMRLIKDVGQD